MKLGKINANELKFTGDIEDDRTNTYLKLEDYDWMYYTLSTRFNTDKYGTLNVEFNYFGSTFSVMKVKRETLGVSENYEFEYDSSIFLRHLTLFMQHHINLLSSNIAFNGESYVLSFYNEIIEKGKINDSN